jgi:hypothetical protein
MILEAYQTYLQSKSIPYVYVSFQPNTSGITLTSYPSTKPDPKFGYDSIRIQVMTRMPTYLAANTLAQSVYSYLEGFNGVLSDQDIIDTQAVQAPYQMDYDEQNNARIVFNIDVQYRNITQNRE